MFPVEIVDNIFSHLDYHSLEASSAAAPFLSRIAERHLYADIALVAWYGCKDSKLPLTIAQLSNLLSERPHIASHVFSLTIEISQSISVDQYLEAFPQVIRLLQNLRKITIERPHGPPYFWDEGWSKLPESFRSSLENSLRLPSMQELEVIGIIAIPLSFLHDCTGIEILKLQGCTISDPELNSPHGGPLIRDLSLVDVRHSSLKRLTPWIAKSCKQLQYFRFSPYSRPEREFSLTIPPILFSCSNALTALDIDLVSSYIYPSFPGRQIPTLPSLPNLKEANFHATIVDYDRITAPTTAFSVLTELLDNLPTLLQLTLHLHIASNFQPNSLDSFGADWTALDSFLVTHCRSAKVIHLRISTRKPCTTKWTDHDVVPHIIGYPNIRRMAEQGTLVITSPLRFGGCYCIRS